MLSRLAVTNFLCFGARACLDLGTPPPVALIVGGNAAGKSSLQKALGALRNLVLGGSRPGQPLPLTPYALLPQAQSGTPTRIELTVQHDGALWTYGFAASPKLIEEEWLTRAEAGEEPRLVFRRGRPAGSGGPVVEFGSAGKDERQRLDLVAYGTRPEQLFLNEALRRGVPAVAPLGVWLRDRLQMILPEAKIVGLAARAAREPRFLEFLSELLREADTGITEVSIGRETVHHDAFENEEEERELLGALTSFPDAFAETPDGELIAERSGRIVDLYRVRLGFRLAAPGGEAAELPASALSDGTLRILHLAPLFYLPKDQPQASAPVFFLDDIARGLHPRRFQALVERFRKTSATRGAQLIATAHDTALVEAGLVEPAHVFVMKRSDSGAVIGPL
jgi:hypothetical protein